MKILVILLGKIGDMILTTPAFSAIKKKFPNAEIYVIAGRRNHTIIKNNPDISKVYVFEKSPLKLLALIIKLFKIKFDWLIDPKDHDSTESHFLARIVRAKKKSGYHSKGKIYDFIVPSNKQNYGVHIIDICMNALKPLGIEPGTAISKPVLFPSAESVRYVKDFINLQVHSPMVLINISTSGDERKWNTDNWCELINSINSNNYSPVMVFSPHDKERAEKIKAGSPGLLLFNSRNMNDIIAIVELSYLVISPDTSVVHVASAFDRPLIALYNHNPMIFHKFSPISSKVLIIRAPEGKEVKDLEPEHVIDEIRGCGLFPGLMN
jgi:ADP-heptose:LPS heptosyltransferase